MIYKSPRKPTCFNCPHNLHYNDTIPKKAVGGMMHMGEQFCTGGKKARRFKRSDPKITVPGWCPRRKNPCELRIYAIKNAGEWWLYDSLKHDLGRMPSPDGFRYALTQELPTELSPWEFWKRLECEPYQDILDVSLEPYSVVEIDDGLKPAFFVYADGGFTLLYSFNTEKARKNKKED